jgi:glycerol kinase
VLADPANASRTLLWDRQTRDWSVELLDLFDIPAECLPECVPSRYGWGALNAAGHSIPVTVITGDQSAALFAFGKPAPDTVYANLGTGAFLQRSISSQRFDPGRLLASVVYQDSASLVSVLEATVNGAGSAINALCEDLGIDRDYMRTNSSRWLNETDELPLFLNGVSGLGSPWWLTNFASEFVGSGSDEQKIAAVIESVAFLLTVNLQTMTAQSGHPARMVVTGGLGSVDPLLQRIASLNQLSVGRAEVSEATARGLAFLLAGMPADWPAANILGQFEPEPDAELAQRFERWRMAMPAVPFSPN